MNIARIVNGTVINIESASQEWIDAQDDPDVTLVAYTDHAPAGIGATWDGKAFTAPVDDYARGKADGAAEQVALQAAPVAEVL
jgi:hypothetical protein